MKIKNKKIDNEGVGKFVMAMLDVFSKVLIFNKIKSLNGALFDCIIDNNEIDIAQIIGKNL